MHNFFNSKQDFLVLSSRTFSNIIYDVKSCHIIQCCSSAATTASDTQLQKQQNPCSLEMLSFSIQSFIFESQFRPRVWVKRGTIQQLVQPPSHTPLKKTFPHGPAHNQRIRRCTVNLRTNTKVQTCIPTLGEWQRSAVILGTWPYHWWLVHSLSPQRFLV